MEGCTDPEPVGRPVNNTQFEVKPVSMSFQVFNPVKILQVTVFNITFTVN